MHMRAYEVEVVSVPQADADVIVEKLGSVEGHADLRVRDVSASEGSGGVAFLLEVHAGGVTGAVAVAVNWASIRLSDAGGAHVIASVYVDHADRWS